VTAIGMWGSTPVRTTGVLVSLFVVVSGSAIDCLERLVSAITHYLSSGTLNPTHSLLPQLLVKYYSKKTG